MQEEAAIEDRWMDNEGVKQCKFYQILFLEPKIKNLSQYGVCKVYNCKKKMNEPNKRFCGYMLYILTIANNYHSVNDYCVLIFV